MPIADLGEVGRSTGTTTTATALVPIGEAVPAGAQLVLWGAYQQGAAVTGITDSRGNVGSVVANTQRGANSWVLLAVLPAATALEVDDVITIAMAGSTTHRAFLARAYSGLDIASPSPSVGWAGGQTAQAQPYTLEPPAGALLVDVQSINNGAGGGYAPYESLPSTAINTSARRLVAAWALPTEARPYSLGGSTTSGVVRSNRAFWIPPLARDLTGAVSGGGGVAAGSLSKRVPVAGAVTGGGTAIAPIQALRRMVGSVTGGGAITGVGRRIARVAGIVTGGGDTRGTLGGGQEAAPASIRMQARDERIALQARTEAIQLDAAPEARIRLTARPL